MELLAAVKKAFGEAELPVQAAGPGGAPGVANADKPTGADLRRLFERAAQNTWRMDKLLRTVQAHNRERSIKSKPLGPTV